MDAVANIQLSSEPTEGGHLVDKDGIPDLKAASHVSSRALFWHRDLGADETIDSLHSTLFAQLAANATSGDGIEGWLESYEKLLNTMGWVTRTEQSESMVHDVPGPIAADIVDWSMRGSVDAAFSSVVARTVLGLAGASPDLIDTFNTAARSKDNKEALFQVGWFSSIEKELTFHTIVCSYKSEKDIEDVLFAHQMKKLDLNIRYIKAVLTQKVYEGIKTGVKKRIMPFVKTSISPIV
ncbi:hypothetical protein CYLTODRAFT_492226 [Cylindrobasidium torrendii FP15055 ss-10]|uniref:Uncharacterized protein n=1 Tax=Cylindrobasidium torrendii FP15055 ss-10 TaxID=1314674 RepID=A0A0D7B7Q4_9AGAR|nr:hypothetical protein CYLTODRAFT_492226 [Cylindrobasidium torrendii FP15055 ss-10]